MQVTLTTLSIHRPRSVGEFPRLESTGPSCKVGEGKLGGGGVLLRVGGRKGKPKIFFSELWSPENWGKKLGENGSKII